MWLLLGGCPVPPADRSLSRDWDVDLLRSQVTDAHAAAAGLDYNVRSVDVDLLVSFQPLQSRMFTAHELVSLAFFRP